MLPIRWPSKMWQLSELQRWHEWINWCAACCLHDNGQQWTAQGAATAAGKVSRKDPTESEKPPRESRTYRHFTLAWFVLHELLMLRLLKQLRLSTAPAREEREREGDWSRTRTLRSRYVTKPFEVGPINWLAFPRGSCKLNWVTRTGDELKIAQVGGQRAREEWKIKGQYK